MLEGLLRGQAGLFPAANVEEVALRDPTKLRGHQADVTLAPNGGDGGSRVAGRREVQAANASSVSSTPTLIRASSRQDVEAILRSRSKL